MNSLKARLLFRQSFKCRSIGQITWHAFDYKNQRINPKCTLEWFKTKEPELYFELKENFPQKQLSEIFWFIKNNIFQEELIPLCEVCGKNKCLLTSKVLKPYCCNRCAIKQQSVQEKTVNTCLARYGKIREFGDRKNHYELGKHPQQCNYKNLDDINNPEIMNKLRKLPWKEIAAHFGLSKNSHSSQFKFMNKVGCPIIKSEKSNMEYELFSFINSICDFNVIRNSKRVIKPLEIDIYIPDLKLAFEFNGDWYHQFQDRKPSLDSNYHVNKTNLCEQQGIRLIHIWEHEWLTNQEYVKEVIKQYLDGKIPDISIYNGKLPRDYFQTLDFSGKIEEPKEELIDNRYKIYKSGWILL